MNKISEKRIETELAKHFSHKDFAVRKQVSFTQKRVDIVLKREHEMWAIEVKIRDWKGALRQALLNSIGFECSYVAIWHEHSKAAMTNIDMFQAAGVGLIVINPDYSADIRLGSQRNEIMFNPLVSQEIFQRI